MDFKNRLVFGNSLQNKLTVHSLFPYTSIHEIAKPFNFKITIPKCDVKMVSLKFYDMKNIPSDDFPLSNDPEENMRMENQLLELKLQAEFGAKTFLDSRLPAAIENEFLKNVIEFEKSFSQSREVKICDILGNPLLRPEADLDDMEIERCLAELNALMLTKDIALDFINKYDARTKYKFITEELLEESVFQIGIPGMVINFIYEEFHPNHSSDLESKAIKFISAWFEKEKDKILWELSDDIILPGGSIWSRDRIADQLERTFEYYSTFLDRKYFITDVNFELDEDSGKGCAEGWVRYNAIIKNDEAISIQGPFKLHFTLEYDWWNIYYFVLPGFDFPESGRLK